MCSLFPSATFYFFTLEETVKGQKKGNNNEKKPATHCSHKRVKRSGWKIGQFLSSWTLEIEKMALSLISLLFQTPHIYSVQITLANRPGPHAQKPVRYNPSQHSPVTHILHWRGTLIAYELLAHKIHILIHFRTHAHIWQVLHGGCGYFQG